METYIDIALHILFSLLAGYISWKVFVTKSKKSLYLALILAQIGGFLIDFDHLFDYFLVFGFHFDFQSFMNVEQFEISGKNYILLHGFEYSLLLGLVTLLVKKKKMKLIFFTLALSSFFHYWTDILLFDIPVEQYFFLYRMTHGFNI